MKRVMLTVAYDGTNYCGWQVQPNANTIEGQLNRHLSDLLQEEISVIGASRTDSGVHALCNLAVFSTDARMPAEKISYALNQRLPDDIRIQKSEEVPFDFHPRKVPTQKTYEYRIYNAQFPNPVERLYSYFTYVPLNIQKMQVAASYMVGTHDFESFSTFKPEIQSTVRTIYQLSVTAAPYKKNTKDQMITIHVTGNGFLYNMVRIIAGTLLDVGRGRIVPEQILDIIEAKDRNQAGPTAPACGLTLVEYKIETNYVH